MLTNLRYRWHSAIYGHVVSSTSSSPVVMLGKTYIRGKHYKSKNKTDPTSYKFIADFKQIPWITYRCDFRPIACQDPTQPDIVSDQGWGCTIRVCQMMLMNVLRLINKSVWPNFDLLQSVQEYNTRAEYSLHKFVAEGLAMQKEAGSWYSPSDVCFILESLVNACNTREFTVKIFTDGVIYKDQLYEACRLEQSIMVSELRSSIEGDLSSISLSESSMDHLGTSLQTFEYDESCLVEEFKVSIETSEVEQGWDRPVLILLPMMLGLREIESDYYSIVKEALRIPESVGIIGGRPRSALYFVGFQDDNLIFLDPHKVQKACVSDTDLSENMTTFVNSSARMIPISGIESSMVLGFLITNHLSLIRFEAHLKEINELTKGLVSVQQTTPNFMRSGGDFKDFMLISKEA